MVKFSQKELDFTEIVGLQSEKMPKISDFRYLRM
jgi:hypothetical protein